ncbi:helix-turn-helix domain-containing protein [Rhodococcus rhodochrous]|uniref:helix-turn-helix domain-containing protein n=1 Tax=Rhodococcus rhodochrous TaxID=1829 RepID=UPI00178374AC|nr:helix-turn-helix domain-containing protein [Rhodococcus rhodochrous]QOH59870.1 hypothetical protein C6Y44_27660 [Rhodococcus rhodochrous]
MAGNGSSYKALEWVWGLSEVTPTQKLVLLSLACRVDQAYSCFPGLKLISKETCLGRSTVIDALNALEANDLLFRATRVRPNGSHSTNRYYLNHPEAPHLTGELDEDDDPNRIAELDQATKRAIAAQKKRRSEG